MAKRNPKRFDYSHTVGPTHSTVVRPCNRATSSRGEVPVFLNMRARNRADRKKEPLREGFETWMKNTVTRPRADKSALPMLSPFTYHICNVS
jgi:hypothetical protein